MLCDIRGKTRTNISRHPTQQFAQQRDACDLRASQVAAPRAARKVPRAPHERPSENRVGPAHSRIMSNFSLTPCHHPRLTIRMIVGTVSIGPCE